MNDLAYLSIGSNLGSREQNLRDAVQRLKSVGTVVSVSSLYETEPVEFTDQPMFLNAAVVLATSATPADLIKQLLEIEKGMGRERIQKKGPRTIDLDIVLFGDRVVNTDELTIPHPAMHQRRFVLEALAEIAPDARHPLFQKTVSELLRGLGEVQSVRRIENVTPVRPQNASDRRPTTKDGPTEE
jgi:2-amino-4-hydroxy-6-hydroxymethyldihydropteridine diphosphokinase